VQIPFNHILSDRREKPFSVDSQLAGGSRAKTHSLTHRTLSGFLLLWLWPANHPASWGENGCVCRLHGTIQLYTISRVHLEGSGCRFSHPLTQFNFSSYPSYHPLEFFPLLDHPVGSVFVFIPRNWGCGEMGSGRFLRYKWEKYCASFLEIYELKSVLLATVLYFNNERLYKLLLNFHSLF
jgi:hypothetical protein